MTDVYPDGNHTRFLTKYELESSEHEDDMSANRSDYDRYVDFSNNSDDDIKNSTQGGK